MSTVLSYALLLHICGNGHHETVVLSGEGGVVERFLPGNAIPPLQSIEYEETGVAWLRDLRLSGNKEYSPSPLENR